MELATSRANGGRSDAPSVAPSGSRRRKSWTLVGITAGLLSTLGVVAFGFGAPHPSAPLATAAVPPAPIATPSASSAVESVPPAPNAAPPAEGAVADPLAAKPTTETRRPRKPRKAAPVLAPDPLAGADAPIRLVPSGI